MYRKRYYMVVVLFVLYIISSVIYLNSGIGLSYDEPHYIVNALALIHGDFNVKDIYLNHEYASFYNGTLDPHVSLNSTNGKWYSIHGYGLSILIVPFVIVGKILHNIPFAIHLFNIIVYVIAFFLFLKIIELRSDNREKTNFLLLLFLFITLPIIIFTNFLAVESIAFLYFTFIIYLFCKINNHLDINKEMIIFIFFTSFLPFVHVKFIVFSFLSFIFIMTLVYKNYSFKRKKIIFYSLFLFISILLLMYLNYKLYGSISISAAYKGSAISLQYLIQGVLGQFLDSQIGLLVNNPIYFLLPIALVSFIKKNYNINFNLKFFILYMISIILITLFLASVHVITLDVLFDYQNNNNLLTGLSGIFQSSSLIPMWFQTPLARFILPVVPFFIFVLISYKWNNFILILLFFISIVFSIFAIADPFLLFRPNVDFEAFSPFFELLAKYTNIDFNYLFPNLLSFQLSFINILLSIAILIMIGIIYNYKKLNKYKFLSLSISFLFLAMIIFIRYDFIVHTNKIFLPKRFYLNKNVYLEHNVAIYKSKIPKDITFSYGPYNYLPYGWYKVSFNIEYNKTKNSSIVMDIYASYKNKQYKSITLKRTNYYNGNIDFIFENKYPESILEFRIFLKKYIGEFKLKNVKLKRIYKKFNYLIPLENFKSNSGVFQNNSLRSFKNNNYIFYGYPLKLHKGKYSIILSYKNKYAKGNFDIYNIKSKKIVFRSNLKNKIIFKILKKSNYELRLYNYSPIVINKIEIKEIK
jgi:hypothetical protein